MKISFNCTDDQQVVHTHRDAGLSDQVPCSKPDISPEAYLNDYRNRMPFHYIEEGSDGYYYWQYGSIMDLVINFVDEIAQSEDMPEAVLDVRINDKSVVDPVAGIAHLGSMAMRSTADYYTLQQTDRIVGTLSQQIKDLQEGRLASIVGTSENLMSGQLLMWDSESRQLVGSPLVKGDAEKSIILKTSSSDPNFASHEGAVLLGKGLRSSSPYQVLLGKYNLLNPSSVFSIGDGSPSRRSSALEVLSNSSLILGGFRYDKESPTQEDRISTSTGFQALVAGPGNYNAGDWSFILGKDNTNYANRAFIFGGANLIQQVSNGQASILKTNVGRFSAIFGNNNTILSSDAASESNLIAGGSNTVDGQRNIVAGYNLSLVGSFSSVFGSANSVRADNTFVSGTKATVSGSGHIVGGISSSVSGAGNLVGGLHSLNRGYYSIAVGYDAYVGYDSLGNPTSSVPTGSAAFGWSRANADYSFSAGRNTEANALASSAFGNSTITGRPYQTVVGVFNSPSAEALFVVGNGSPSGRSNAFEVLASGESIAKDLLVRGNLTVQGTSTVLNTQSLTVEDNLIITNSNKNSIIGLSGLAINKDSESAYGIVLDPEDELLKLGLGKVEEDGTFSFLPGEAQALATRDYADARLRGKGLNSIQQEGSQALGDYSVAVGYHSVSSQVGAISIGSELSNSTTRNKVVLGINNIDKYGNILEIGNGSDSTRSNALEVSLDGSVFVQSSLLIGGTDKDNNDPTLPVTFLTPPDWSTLETSVTGSGQSLSFGARNYIQGDYNITGGLFNTIFAVDARGAQIAVNRSMAIGKMNQVRADDSAAIGDTNLVTGDNSVALAYHNNIYADASVALGHSNTIGTAGQTGNTAQGSVAAGHGNILTGTASFAANAYNEVKSDYAAAFGGNNKANGFASFVAGEENEVTGRRAIAFGYQNKATNEDAAAFGSNTKALNKYTAAFGLNSEAQAECSAVFGNHNIVSGYAGFAVGQDNTITAQKSFTAGGGNTISAGYSAAVGEGNTITATISFAANYGNTVSGYCAAAFGYKNTAAAAHTFVAGQENESTNQRNFIYGYKNKSDRQDSVLLGTGLISDTAEKLIIVGNYNSPVNIIQDETLFVVGGGYSNVSRKNTFVVNRSNIYADAKFNFTTAEGKTLAAESLSIGVQKNSVGQTVVAPPLSRNYQSIRVGENNIVENYKSGVFGTSNSLTGGGENSFIFGGNNTVEKSYSFMFGRYLQDKFRGSWWHPKFTIGRYNLDTEEIKDRIFVVGNGTSDSNRSNAFEILADGRAKVLTAPVEDNDVVRLEELKPLQKLVEGLTEEQIMALNAFAKTLSVSEA